MNEMSLTTSVLMATYNGTKFLIPQLDSIRLQTDSADEVIICDDGSTDETVQTIQGYIEKYGLESWHLSRNEKNKGWMQNFMDMAINCHTDLIFFADQDDIWNLQKIEQMKKAISDNSKIDLLYSDYKFVKKFSNLEERGEWIIKKNPKIKRDSNIYKYSMVTLGCSYCLRKSFVDEIKDLYWKGCPHDAFFYRAALIKGTLYSLNSKLIYHRIHENNTSFMSLAEQKDDDMLKYRIEIIQNLIEYAISIGNTTAQNILSNAFDWNNTRNEFFKEPNIKNYFRLIKFHKYYFRVRTFIKEYFIARAIN